MTTTDLSAELLFTAIAAIERWPEWDHELEWARISGEVRVGAPFTLKPKRGPQVAMAVVDMQRPTRFSDLARLPLARMRTDHQFASSGTVTTVTVTISISGPLAFVWDRVVARKQAAGAQVQTAAFLAFARALA
ncbi:hypothetical protein [Sphingomonas bacterium]|nr:hypothetical protein [Sphingomonas bacterium]